MTFYLHKLTFGILLLLGLSATSLAAPTVPPVPTIVIDQIEILGVTVFTSEDIQSALSINVGDVFDRSQILRTSHAIEDLYRTKGFERAQVRSELIRRKLDSGRMGNVLVLTVEEGKLSRIRSVQVRFSAIRVKDRSFDPEDLRKALLVRSILKSGEVLSHDLLSENYRVYEDYLENQDFVGAKQVSLKFEDAPAPPDVSAEIKASTSQWVDVVYEIDLGDRISFGFRGNKLFTKAQLMALVYEQRNVGFGPDYPGAIAQRVRQLYWSHGFAEVDVTFKTFDRSEKQARHVTYFIEEGERYRIGGVTFEGNENFSNEVLKQHFFSSAPLLTERGYYVQKEIEVAADQVMDWIKSQGYIFARVISISPVFNRERHQVFINIFVFEGAQTLIQDILVRGLEHSTSGMTEAEIFQILSIQKNQPLNLFALGDGIENLKTYYRNKGYLSFTILNEAKETIVQYSNRNRTADIVLELSEGLQYRVGRIFIEGLTKTRVGVAERELQFLVGDVLTDEKISESESRLRRLGLFASVRIQHRDTPGMIAYKDVRVLLTEGTPGLLAGGVGIRSDLGLRVFGSAGYSNIWHRNHAISLTGAANRRFENYCQERTETDPSKVCFIEFRFRLGYTWPWFVVDELKFRPSIVREKKRYRQFDATSTAFSAVFERPLLKQYNLLGSFTYNFEQIEQFNAEAASPDNPKYSPDNVTLLIGSIVPALQLDLRDNPLAPTKGSFFKTSFEVASTLFGSQKLPFAIGYTKLQFRSDHHIPVASKIGILLSFRTGVERNIIDPLDFPTKQEKIGIPLIKQFTLGGASSLRGFKEQELNFTSEAVKGTLTYVNYRSQIDLPLTGDMRFGPFFDAGNLKLDQYSLGNLRYTAGVGFRYLTPVGPVNFDWGFKLNPEKGEDLSVFYFTVGIL